MYYETSWDLDGFWLVFCSYRGDARNDLERSALRRTE
ncbi:hypothetical protein DW903_14625 [Ruminococcus sp. AM42-10AC]|nr:hypothetical protein DW903_14625 [Ruminococcus sp. AM42-10AC]